MTLPLRVARLANYYTARQPGLGLGQSAAAVTIGFASAGSPHGKFLACVPDCAIIVNDKQMEEIMAKPFTVLAALLFLSVAAVHAYRVYTGFAVVVAGHTIPLWGSWIGVAVAALFGVMLLVESRR